MSSKDVVVGGIVLFAIALIVFVCTGLSIIRPGTVGVPVRFGKVVHVPMEEGLHFVNPLTTGVKRMTVKIQKNELSTEAATKDLQTVTATIAINYALSKDKATTLFQTIGNGYFEILMSPLVMEVFKAEASNYNAEELITQRSHVSLNMIHALSEKYAPYGILLKEFSIVQFDFEPEFDKAVEQKIIAEQKALQSEREVEQTKFKAQQEIAMSEGKAKALLVVAEAEAQSYRLKSEALTDKLVLVEAIKKWDGVLPTHFLGNGTLPVLNVGDNLKSDKPHNEESK